MKPPFERVWLHRGAHAPPVQWPPGLHLPDHHRARLRKHRPASQPSQRPSQPQERLLPPPVSDFLYPFFGVLRSHCNRAAITFWYIMARYTLPKGGIRSLRMWLG